MRYASVCSGVEAASLAWGALGREPVWFSEIEPFPCEVLKVRFPSVPNLGDMTKIKGKDYAGCVDLLVGGTPCQDLSVAGKRAGLAGERSSLAIDFVRLAYEMQCKWFVWENVPGCLSSGSNKGGDFATLLSLFTGRDVDVPKGGWCNSGFVRNTRPDRFGVAWRILDAQFTRTQSFPFAVPQRRRRVFVVGYFGDWRRSAEVLLEPGRVCWDTPPRIKTRERIAPSLARCTARSIGNGQVDGLLNPPELAQTLNCMHDQQAVICYENHANDSRIKEMGDCCQALTSRAGTGGGNLPLVQACYAFEPGVAKRDGGDSRFTEELAGTLRSEMGDNQTAVAIAENIIGRADNAGGNGVGAQEEVAYTQNATGVMGVQSNATVRRLLPIECERLMGFPDNHTRIPRRGKTEEECPDSPRYKACGNSMCVNVMQWIGEQIQKVEEDK